MYLFYVIPLRIDHHMKILLINGIQNLNQLMFQLFWSVSFQYTKSQKKNILK